MTETLSDRWKRIFLTILLTETLIPDPSFGIENFRIENTTETFMGIEILNHKRKWTTTVHSRTSIHTETMFGIETFGLVLTIGTFAFGTGIPMP